MSSTEPGSTGPGSTEPGSTAPGAPGWYPDPYGGPGLRYFDGTAWTPHHAVPSAPTYPTYPVAPAHPAFQWWKGAQLGLPQAGPGALAEPGRRLGARLLDGLVLLPVWAGFLTAAGVLVAPHVGPVVTGTDLNGRETTNIPGLGWIYLAVFSAVFAAGLVTFLYEWISTAAFGRTLGKRWLHIHPLRMDGSTIGWGRALGRAGGVWIANTLGWIGLIDSLWCLWDENRQCVHDKVVDTIVVNDGDVVRATPPVQRPTAPSPAWTPPAWPTPSAPAGTPPAWPPPSAPAGTAPAWPPPGVPAAAPPTPWYPGAVATPPPRTSGMAVAGLVCSIVGVIIFGLPAVVGVILGFISRGEIRRSGGRTAGSGLALAAIIVGFVAIALWLALFIAAGVTGNNTSS